MCVNECVEVCVREKMERKERNCWWEKEQVYVCEGQLVLQAHLGPPGGLSSWRQFYWPQLTAMKWHKIYGSEACGAEG